MLDKIQGNISETIAQSQGLEKTKGLGVSSPFEDDEKAFFIDRSDISSAAMEKYQREIDVKNFSEIFNQTDEKEATELVLSKVFNGQFSIDNDDILMELLNSDSFLSDVFEE